MSIIDKLKKKGQQTLDGLKKQFGFGGDGNPWPQTTYNPEGGDSGLSLLELYPNYKTSGWLPPVRIPIGNPMTIGQVEVTDWRGVKLNLSDNILDTKDRFNESITLPKLNEVLTHSPYSTRDGYLIQDDSSTDYFRHDLQTVHNLTPIENPTNGRSYFRLNNFKGTPFENSDPIVYGFEIIIDTIHSPLFNGSVLDFIRNYNNVSEIASREEVYNEFLQQFSKFFKTNADLTIDEIENSITKMRDASYPESERVNGIFLGSKKAYFNYYIKKISGLDKLIERNTAEKKEFLNSYNKDVISLNLSEDISMSVGTLAHLYKLLYWSKPNGKNLIPENLLRFNCDIVVSEVRNLQRVRSVLKELDDGLNDLNQRIKSIEVIKDNVSRYIYSLKECQFYFNTMPHPADIKMNLVEDYAEGNYTLSFDYKFVTHKLERFVPTADGFGQYIGYDGGSIWRIVDGTRAKSIPDFKTVGENKLNQTGVEEPFVTNIYDNDIKERILSTNDLFNMNERNKTFMQKLEDKIEDTIISGIQREAQTFVNNQMALLNKTLNKVTDSIGLTTMRPPTNVYDDYRETPGSRIFFDVRGQMVSFLGESLGGLL